MNSFRCKLCFNPEYSHPIRINLLVCCGSCFKSNYNDAPVSSLPCSFSPSSLLAKYIKPQRERAGWLPVRVSVGQGQAASSTSGRQRAGRRRERGGRGAAERRGCHQGVGGAGRGGVTLLVFHEY